MTKCEVDINCRVYLYTEHTTAANVFKNSGSHKRSLHRLDNALLDKDTRLGSLVESVRGRPFRADRLTEGSFILLSVFERMRKLCGHVFHVLDEYY